MYSKYHLIKVFGSFFWNYELLFLDQANSSSYPSEILIIQFIMIQTFLQHNTHHVLHRFRYFVLPQASTRHHKYWIYQTICQAKPIKFIIKLCTDHYNLWDNTLPIKKLSLQELFSFKVRQHGQQQLHLQYKVCWFFCKVVGTPSFSEPYLFKQPPLQSPPKIRSSSVNFHLPTLPLLIHKFILAILTNASFLYQFLTFLFLRTTIPTIYPKTIFPINGRGS